MAKLLDINGKTVINAYQELLSQQWIDVAPRKGYRVITELPAIKPRSFQPKNHFNTFVYGNLKFSDFTSPAAESRKTPTTDNLRAD